MVSYSQPGVVVTDHTFAVPLDHASPDGERIEVFAREVAPADRPPGTAGDGDLPWLVYLQGGPGFGGPRLVGRDSWLDRALADFRVLLLDGRGTGRSTPVSRHTLAARGPAGKQAEYLSHFRADAIVADAELIRRELAGGRPWSVLGQSFGGFCALTYLSFAPEGLAEVFITGGLAGLSVTAADVYRLTYPKVKARTLAHYQRYPVDAAQARRVARHLHEREVRLPGGGRLTVEAFQSLGRMLGSSTGSHELHYLLEDPFTGGELSDPFLAGVQAKLSFATGPLYALLHEACYGQGAATRWAAQRVRAEFAEFDPAAALDGGAPLLFTGEMIYPWMLELDPVLAPVRAAGEAVAEWEGWPALYDQARLAENGVPAAAAVYFNDMYVPAEFSLPAAAAVRGLRTWVTNEYEHDGLRVSGGTVLDRLIALARGLT
ncbi:MAG TPA: alpha/beta fold hydrolase [Streptosporangiaceae bacterium]|jgi:pimeloyl-ACP methyl ester carboxylesterase